MARKSNDKVVKAFNSEIWAMAPDKVEAIAELMKLVASGKRFSPEDVQARIGDRQTPTTRRSGAVAVLPLFGVIAHRMNLMSEVSGGTSTEQFGAAYDAAMKDPEIGSIILDVASPGGSTAGLFELADRMRAWRGTKPVTAVANAEMASAAYLIAAQADEVVASPSALVGSIGIVVRHVDHSEANAKAGEKVTYITSSTYKAEGNPDAPLDDEALAAIKAIVAEHDGLFATGIAKGRGITAAAVRANYGDGRILSARQALDAGLIDRIASLDQVIAEHARGKPPNKRSPHADAPDLALAAASMGGGSISGLSDGAVAALATGPLTVTAAGGPAAVRLITPSTTAPAPKAKEHPVQDNDTAATNGAAPVQTDSNARYTALLELAEGHGKSIADVKAWMAAGKTPEQVGRELLNQYRESAKPIRDTGAITVGVERETLKPWGHVNAQGKNLDGEGEFFNAVRNAATGGVRDPRLNLYAAASGGSQGVPADGGFLVPPQFASSIYERMSQDENSLLSQTDSYTIEGESMTFNADAETSRADGSRAGGVQGYWISEAASITSSKPTFRQARVEPQELAVLVYQTDKVLRNSNIALGQYVSRKAAEEIVFMTGNAIYNGNGVGQPKGLMSAGSLVSVAKETSQAAATINQKNISKMWARLHPRFRSNAVWLHNVDIEPQLDNLSTTVTNVAGTENVGGYANKVFDPGTRTLKGRPLQACEFSATLGTQGDLMLVDLKQYLTGVRGGIDSAMSIHVGFVTAQTAFRFMFEVDGQPWLASALTPFKGTATLTSHVVLDTRA